MAKKKASQESPEAAKGAESKYVPRLKARYVDDIVPKLQQEFGIDNVCAVPRIDKMSLNIGLGEASRNFKLLEAAQVELTAIAGQAATITRAKKSIAAFKLREGTPIGCRVTLRGRQMWDFLDRLISMALPRVRDFRGVSSKSFDGRGNYTLGVREHMIFPEVDTNRVEASKGMNITIVTSGSNDEQTLFMLKELGMPFALPSNG